MEDYTESLFDFWNKLVFLEILPERLSFLSIEESQTFGPLYIIVWPAVCMDDCYGDNQTIIRVYFNDEHLFGVYRACDDMCDFGVIEDYQIISKQQAIKVLAALMYEIEKEANNGNSKT